MDLRRLMAAEEPGAVLPAADAEDRQGLEVLKALITKALLDVEKALKLSVV